MREHQREVLALWADAVEVDEAVVGAGAGDVSIVGGGLVIKGTMEAIHLFW